MVLIYANDLIIIKMSGSDSRPRKVELTRAHSKNATTTVSIVHIRNNGACFVFTKTNLMAMIFIS